MIQFASGNCGSFDLVIGGVVCRHGFGPEHDYLRHLGLYVALADLSGESHAVRRNRGVSAVRPPTFTV